MYNKDNFTMYGIEPLQQMLVHNSAVEELYRIICGRECEKILGANVCKTIGENFCTYGFDLLFRLRSKSLHLVTIRVLEKMEDLEKYRERPLKIFEYENETGELCSYVPTLRLMICFLLSEELPAGQVVYKTGFPTGEDDLEGYSVEMPTIIVTTEGEGDGSELSELARYLKCPDPGEPRFGAIGEVVERIREQRFLMARAATASGVKNQEV